ncbi:hypothetical protein [Acuticoccus kandeliae]|uniref:hypothetical protein n=1 Tax=Acuticoccus kandeliae TaxID=2073160 RepID=UPI0013007D3E|nr:hypothetical protein [Acuticoccus kandeliae]
MTKDWTSTPPDPGDPAARAALRTALAVSAPEDGAPKVHRLDGPPAPAEPLGFTLCRTAGGLVLGVLLRPGANGAPHYEPQRSPAALRELLDEGIIV